MKLYGHDYTKEELLERVGDINQIASIKDIVLNDGGERGVRAAQVRNATGLHYEILLDRGMDISFAHYKGIPLCWHSAVGDIRPDFFDAEGEGWLRSFFGGLLTTCGLTYVGAPCQDQGQKLGRHGRINNIPASNVHLDGQWIDDKYFLRAVGRVRETTSVGGENLQRIREIKTPIGEPAIYIHDTVENLGYKKTEHMVLFHINIGFPIIDEGSRLISPSLKVQLLGKQPEEEEDKHDIFHGPKRNFQERVFYHDMNTDRDGYVTVALFNSRLKNGFGIYVKYDKENLPNFVEWKMNGQGNYVVALEPSNCFVEGRDKDRERGTLSFLDPGERRDYKLKIGVLTSQKEIDDLIKK